MPIYWWYLLKSYFNVLILAVLSFIAILLVSRLEEIAQFAALGAKTTHLIIFTLYQIPYVLPIAIPISCLISSILLFQRLSHTHELTALRSGGISLLRIVAPILCAATVLSMGTFYIVSEVATASHLATKKMFHEMTAANPLLLLQSAKIARLQSAFIQMDPIRNGESVRNLIIAFHNPSTNRLNVGLANHVEMKEGQLHAQQVSLITSSPSKKTHDHLVIESQKWMKASAKEFASLLKKSGWKMANDHLKMSLLRIRLQELRDHLSEGQKNSRNYKKCLSEFVRRFSVASATFTFTLLGSLFGMEIGRNRSKTRLLWALLLTGATLIAFCLGKTLGHLFWIATLLFLVPHIVIILSSLWNLNRINRGIE